MVDFRSAFVLVCIQHTVRRVPIWGAFADFLLNLIITLQENKNKGVLKRHRGTLYLCHLLIQSIITRKLPTIVICLIRSVFVTASEMTQCKRPRVSPP